MKILNIFFCLALLLSTTACIRDAENVKVTPENPRLVVTCFISPSDTLIKVKVGKSVPLLGRIESNYNGNYISNAQVSISDGEKRIQLVYDSRNYLYSAPTLDFKIEAGKTYFLDVNTPDGMNVSSSTVVPAQKVVQEDILITSEVSVDNNSKTFQVTFKDLPGQPNFYRIEAYYSDSSSWNNTIYNYSVFWENDNGYNLYSDINFEDKQIKSLRASVYSDNTITFMVHHLSRDYYLYHQSIENFQGESPFSEPVLVYSNIKNGLGVFAGYNTTVVKFEK